MKYLNLFLLISTLIMFSLGINYQQKVSVAVQSISNIELSYDEQFLIAMSSDLRLFNIYNGITLALIQTVRFNTTVPIALGFSHTSRYLSIGDNNGNIYLFEQISKEMGFNIDTVRSYNATGPNGIRSIVFNNDDTLVAFGGFNKTIIVWDIRDLSNLGAPVPVANINFDQIVNTLAWSPSGDLIAGGANSTMKFYSRTNNFSLIHQFTVASQVSSITFSDDGSLIYSTGSVSYVTVWNSQTFAEVQRLSTNATVLYEVIISQGGLNLAAAGNFFAYVWQRESTSANWNQTQLISNNLANIAFSSNGGQLIIIQGANSIQYSLCGFKLFYNQPTNNCVPCLDTCNLCSGSSQNCYQCNVGFFLSGNTCLACSVGCAACQSFQVCDTCRTADNFIKNGNQCVCIPSYFLRVDTCVSCIVGCINCDNDATCTSCDTASNFVLNISGQCECNIRYRLEAAACVPCGASCFRCDSTECLICDSANHYIPTPGLPDCQCDTPNNFTNKAGKCVCIDTRFLNDNGTCQLCPSTCILCQSKFNCTSCKNGVTLLDGKCYCLDGTYFDGTTCQTCTTIPYCQLCDSGTNCLKCDNTLNRISIGGVCLCDKGYFEDNITKLCSSCIVGCDQCLNNVQCTKCSKQNHWIIVNKVCQCQTRYININNVCLYCGSGCLTCEAVNVCAQCDIQRNWYLDNTTKQCKCQAQRYFDGDITCAFCPNGCSACTSAINCSSCFVQFILNDQGLCDCAKGFYASNRTNCAKCTIPGCEDCNSPTTCVTCAKQFIQVNFTCKCQDGKYIDGDICTVCSDNCLICSGKDKCQKCADGYDLDGGVCSSGGISVLVIVLIVVGGLALIGVGFALFKYCRGKKASKQEQQYQPLA